MKNQWFDVDKEGLRQLIEQHGKGRLIAELLQNAFDEEVTAVTVRLTLLPGRSLAELIVEDDAPQGFRDLGHAYTLFAASYKKAQPEKRGRFNLGEKLTLAVCQEARIATTTGTVAFTADGKRRVLARRKRERGSEFRAILRMTRAEFDEACAYVRTLLPPEGVAVSFNGEPLPSRHPIHTFEATLETEVADEEGFLRRRIRKTVVRLFEPLPGEVPTLYELGLPVVETGDRWHIDVSQKVPLTVSRDNVPPAFLRDLRTLVLNEMHRRLNEEDAHATWVQQATSDPACSNEAIATFLDLRFGTNRASFDPSDPEANKAVQASGGVVVTGRMLNRQQWRKARDARAIEPAGKVRPTTKPYSLDLAAPAAEVIPASQWSAAIRNVVDYAAFLAWELMGVTLTVTIVRTTNNFLACYGAGRLDLNLLRLGEDWFEQGAGEDMDCLLIHEFGHQYSGDHLSDDYHEALCRLGAKLKQLALNKPDVLHAFAR